jgi:hypothetical protein
MKVLWKAGFKVLLNELELSSPMVTMVMGNNSDIVKKYVLFLEHRIILFFSIHGGVPVSKTTAWYNEKFRMGRAFMDRIIHMISYSTVMWIVVLSAALSIAYWFMPTIYSEKFIYHIAKNSVKIFTRRFNGETGQG